MIQVTDVSMYMCRCKMHVYEQTLPTSKHWLSHCTEINSGT